MGNDVKATVACELLPTGYHKLMEGFGGAGETIRSAEQIPAAPERAFASAIPYLITVRILVARFPQPVRIPHRPFLTSTTVAACRPFPIPVSPDTRQWSTSSSEVSPLQLLNRHLSQPRSGSSESYCST